jgi:hypothetical protein
MILTEPTLAVLLQTFSWWYSKSHSGLSGFDTEGDTQSICTKDIWIQSLWKKGVEIWTIGGKEGDHLLHSIIIKENQISKWS